MKKNATNVLGHKVLFSFPFLVSLYIAFCFNLLGFRYAVTKLIQLDSSETFNQLQTYKDMGDCVKFM